MIKTNLKSYILNLIPSKKELDERIPDLGFRIEIVSKLPLAGKTGVLYLLEKEDVYECYVWDEKIKEFNYTGAMHIALHEHYTKDETQTLLGAKADKKTATDSTNGLMGKDDKVKLDNVYTEATTTSYSPILESGVKIGTIAVNNQNNDVFVQTNEKEVENYYTKTETNTLFSQKADKKLVTRFENGLMSSNDKVKLDNVSDNVTKTEYRARFTNGIEIGEITINGIVSGLYVSKKGGKIDVLTLENATFIHTTGDDVTGNGSLKKPFKTFQKALHEINDNGVIYFLPGEYSFSKNEITKSCTVYGCGEVILTATANNEHFDIQNNVNIENITFKNGNERNGGSIYVSDESSYNKAGKLIARSCNFLNNTAVNGGAIYNDSEEDMKLENCIFINNTAENKGGAVFSRKGNVSAFNCEFKDNKTAIYSNSDVVIDNSIFTNNKFSVFAKNSEISYSVFENEQNYDDDSIKVENELMLNYSKIISFGSTKPVNCEKIINNITIINNVLACTNNYYSKNETDVLFSEKASRDVATQSKEGLMNADDKSKLDSVHDRATKIGYTSFAEKGSRIGTITINNKRVDIISRIKEGEKNVILENVVFVSENNNKTQDGSLKFPYSSLEKAIQETKPGDNVFILPGIYTEFSVQNVTKSCRIVGQGTVIFNAQKKSKHLLIDLEDDGEVVIENITFADGVGENGGSIQTYNGKVKMKNCNFLNNTALNGGAIYNDSKEDMKLENCVFSNNTAENKGGTIYNNNMKIIGCEFSNSTAKEGGSIYNEVGKITIINSDFKHIYAESGAIYTHTPYEFTIENSKFFDVDSKNEGGAIHAVYAKINIINCEFVQNHAGSKAGAIYTYNELNIQNSRFKETHTERTGGAIAGKSNITINKSFFEHASANIGGAIYNEVKKTIIKDCTFLECSAQNSIGAVSSNELDIQDSEFYKCTATYNAGAVHTQNAMMENTVFHECVAETGAAISTTEEVNCFRCSFIKNEGKKQAAGIYSEKNVKIDYCFFALNTALEYIDIVASENIKTSNCVFNHGFRSRHLGRKQKTKYPVIKNIQAKNISTIYSVIQAHHYHGYHHRITFAEMVDGKLIFTEYSLANYDALYYPFY